jgi:hypothetical protein
MLSISTDHNGNGGHIHRYHHTHKALDPYLLSTHHILRYKSTSPHRDTDQHRLWYLLPSSSTQTNINISQVALYGPATILALIFTCSPIEAYWYRFTTSWLRTHKYHCVDEVAYLVAVITISIFSHACCPCSSCTNYVCHCVRNLDWLVCFFWVLRAYSCHTHLLDEELKCVRVCATGALRIHYAHRVYYYTKLNPSPTYDISWEALGSWVSTAVEANVAIMCASAPALNAYFKGWFGVTGYQERSFGWYRETERSCSPAREMSDGSNAACLRGKELRTVAPPWRSCSFGAASPEGLEILQRQDSVVPILPR